MSSFDGVAGAYCRSFARLCAGTIPVLLDVIGHGAALLDVGCGAGDLALAAADEGREVHAVDPDPDMVDLTREAAAVSGARIGVREAGCPVLPFASGSVPAVTANFVVNHVQDPRATVRDLARVAAPSAPIALTIWPYEPGPHLAAYAGAARFADAVPVPSTRLPPERDFPRSADGLADVAREAGLRITRAEEIGWTWRTGADDLMAGIAGGVGGPGRVHRAQTDAVRADIESRVRGAWSEYADAHGILAFPVTAVLVVAAAP